LSASSPNSALVKKLQASASRYTWVAAAVGANTAAGYQLGSGDPVMAIGGFNGTDPDPSLAAFKKLVSEGKVHYFIAGGGGFPGFGGFGGFGGGALGRFGGFAGRLGTSATGRLPGPGGLALGGAPRQSGDSQAITTWVEAHYTSSVVGGVTLYDLSAPKA
jgi:4-amino-4-deoxy-L-arabinose transferase-like glycosyltransferase